MRRALVLSTSLLLLAAFTWAAQADSKDPKKIAEAVDRHYNSLQSLRADFTESYEGAGLRRVESGEMELLKPGKMRWQYQKPTDKLFITDGKNAFFYIPAQRQVRKVPVKQLDDFRSPMRYLLGHSRLAAEIEGLKFSNDKPVSADDLVLEGVPKSMKEVVERLVLELNPQNQITRIRIEQVDGSVTEFLFSNITENVPLTSAAFKFAPPPGVETIEGDASF